MAYLQLQLATVCTTPLPLATFGIPLNFAAAVLYCFFPRIHKQGLEATYIIYISVHAIIRCCMCAEGILNAG